MKEFRELGLDWLIITVASHNYDKSCILELQSVKLKEAAHAVDILTSKATVAGMLVKYALQTTGGVLSNPTGSRFQMQSWGDINKNNTMSMENLLKISAEIFPEIDAIFVGYQNNAFMAWKNTPDGRFAHFSYQYPDTDTRAYFYTNPDTGYVYKDNFGRYQRISYVVTGRPWCVAPLPLFFTPISLHPLYIAPELCIDYLSIA